MFHSAAKFTSEPNLCVSNSAVRQGQWGAAQPRDVRMFSPVAQARYDMRAWEHRNHHCGDATAWSSQMRTARRTERAALPAQYIAI